MTPSLTYLFRSLKTTSSKSFLELTYLSKVVLLSLLSKVWVWKERVTVFDISSSYLRSYETL